MIARAVALAILISLLAALAPAQSFLFVSPNTREHMTDQSALQSLDSFEQENFLAVARFFSARLCSKPQVQSTEGMDGANTENSAMISGCSSGSARYLGELLARYGHQKWILVFDPKSGSSERLVVLSFNSDHPSETPGELRAQGIKAGTVVGEGNQVHIYIWVPDHSQDAVLQAFAQARHGTLEEISGKGSFIGDDQRARAQQIFDQRIQLYERVHHRSFSKLLWSKQLHDLGLAAAH